MEGDLGRDLAVARRPRSFCRQRSRTGCEPISFRSDQSAVISMVSDNFFNSARASASVSNSAILPVARSRSFQIGLGGRFALLGARRWFDLVAAAVEEADRGGAVAEGEGPDFDASLGILLDAAGQRSHGRQPRPGVEAG